MNHNQEIRYSRQIIITNIGTEGQEKLLQARILVIGAGGLGSPCLLYLAASGVGNIGIIDDDKVEISNLQRQIIHETSDIGRYKTDSANDAIYDLNPDINITQYKQRLTKNNIKNIFANYDIIADGSDNIPTRKLINLYCHKMRKPLISAAIRHFDGQLAVFKSYINDEPCYNCLYPNISSDEKNCSESGVLSPVAGIIGSWQAMEAIKEILNIGDSLVGKLLIFNGLNSAIRKVKIGKDKDCICCK